VDKVREMMTRVLTEAPSLGKSRGTVRLWRASDHDDVFAGMSLSEDYDAALAYTDNPGFGGSEIYYADVVVDGMNIFDLHDWLDLAIAIGLDLDADPDADRDLAMQAPGYLASAVPALEVVKDGLKEAGYDWVRVVDDYPEGTITWQPISDDALESINLVYHSTPDPVSSDENLT
jgi:hypothetical protein